MQPPSPSRRKKPARGGSLDNLSLGDASLLGAVFAPRGNNTEHTEAEQVDASWLWNSRCVEGDVVDIAFARTKIVSDVPHHGGDAVEAHTAQVEMADRACLNRIYRAVVGRETHIAITCSQVKAGKAKGRAVLRGELVWVGAAAAVVKVKSVVAVEMQVSDLGRDGETGLRERTWLTAGSVEGHHGWGRESRGTGKGEHQSE